MPKNYEKGRLGKCIRVESRRRYVPSFPDGQFNVLSKAGNSM